ncbi:MAG: hypothetical protein K0R34_11 [Herbinix sp.]|jgi:hypothetical protein|nr:hypothetical protein [Herbinix sp.]
MRDMYKDEYNWLPIMQYFLQQPLARYILALMRLLEVYRFRPL